MIYLKIGWRVLRALALCTYIALAALALVFTTLVYVFSGNKGSKTAQAKDLHMIKSTRKSIVKSARAITR